MAGIYIHIPFCKQACHYCDFHFSTNLTSVKAMVNAIILEIKLRKEFVNNERIQSIYFGGGTPSILDGEDVKKILKAIDTSFALDNPEITLEANPDDVTPDKLKSWKRSGINRLSIGTQTFDPNTLKTLNRSHTAEQSRQSLLLAREHGFTNLTADLIFAIPPEQSSFDRFKNDLTELISFNLDHISLYNLTVEAKTVFGHLQSTNSFDEVSEKSSAEQFEFAIERLGEAGYEQYEISNFAVNKNYSRHNSSYWKSQLYLGVGPGAHSYNGVSRVINISNNARYLKAINKNELLNEVETLSIEQQLNEYLMTRLRTKWGIDFDLIKTKWDYDLTTAHAGLLDEMVRQKHATVEKNELRLTKKGFLIADEIALRLFSNE